MVGVANAGDVQPTVVGKFFNEHKASVSGFVHNKSSAVTSVDEELSTGSSYVLKNISSNQKKLGVINVDSLSMNLDRSKNSLNYSLLEHLYLILSWINLLLRTQ